VQASHLPDATLMAADQDTVFSENPQGGKTDVILMHVGYDDCFDPGWIACMLRKEFLTFRFGLYSAIDQNSGPPCPEHQAISAAPRTDRFEVKSHHDGR